MVSRNVVSAIIPARNEEETVAQAVESVAAQPEVAEVIVVNDQSSDRTGKILSELASRIAKLRVLETHELPAGWVGKNHAAALGAAAARGNWLLFTDADTDHLPGSAKRALADANKYGARLVSYSPEQKMGTFWERALIPVVFWRLERKYSYAEVNELGSPRAAANGQYLLVRRDVYEAIGGHAAVAREIVEDVALARNSKLKGYKIHFASGRGIVRTRMYRNFGAMWEGWTKNLNALMGGWLALADLVAWGSVGIILGIMAGQAVHSLRWGVGIGEWGFFGAMCVEYVIYLKRNRYPVRYIGYFVPGVILYLAARAASWWKSTRGSVEWKGREYRAGAS